MAAEGDATTNKVVKDWAPLTIYFSVNNVVDFVLAFAFKQRDCGFARTILFEQIELQRNVHALLHSSVHRERLGESHVSHQKGQTMRNKLA